MRLSSCPIIAVLVLAPVLTACVPVIVGGAVVGVSAARQERTVGNAVDDVRIKSSLDGKLANESAGLYFRVSTSVVEGRVLIAGRVDSPEARLGASRMAWSIDGVRKVDNDVEVTDSSGWIDGPQDLYLQTRLAATLLTDKSIKDINYTTDVVHGVVYIIGVAQDQGEIDRVLAHAHNIGGVKRVENYVVLKDDPIRYGFAVVKPPR